MYIIFVNVYHFIFPLIGLVLNVSCLDYGYDMNLTC